MLTPHDAFKAAIARWEGQWQADPKDHGNFTPKGKLVGTMRGVTVNTYAAFLNRDPETISPDEMQQNITLDVAAAIYTQFYYMAPKLDAFPWSPLIEAVADTEWGSGTHGVKLLQRLVGVPEDGVVGPKTIAGVAAYLKDEGMEKAVDRFDQIREAFYKSLNQPRFLAGWDKRAGYYTTANKAWWKEWQMDGTQSSSTNSSPGLPGLSAGHVVVGVTALAGLPQVTEVVHWLAPTAPATSVATVILLAVGGLYHLLAPFVSGGRPPA